MRLFHIPAAYLPTKILTVQHRTLHLLMSACVKGSGVGGVARYLNHAGLLLLLHHDCVQEMRVRGGAHRSPMADYAKTLPRRRNILLCIPPERVALDISDLQNKILTRPGFQDARLPLRLALGALDRMLRENPAVKDEWQYE